MDEVKKPTRRMIVTQYDMGWEACRKKSEAYHAHRLAQEKRELLEGLKDSLADCAPVFSGSLNPVTGIDRDDVESFINAELAKLEDKHEGG